MSHQLPSSPSVRSLSSRTRAISLLALLAIPSAAFLAGCADEPDNYYNYYYTIGQGGAGGAGEAGGAGGVGGTGGAPAGEYPGAPVADTEVTEHALDVFGAVGNRYWFAVSEEQLELMNESVGGVGIPIRDVGFGDIYSPTGEDATFVDHLWVTTAGDDGKTADYGKVQVGVVGQSTMRPWTKRAIPNLNIDADEFVDQQRLGGFEHVRFNNGQVGSIFRERLTLELYARLDYPAPLANYAWVSSNVWGAEVSIPYIVVERYKKAFCERVEGKLGGGCANMWEFVGDFAGNMPGGGGPRPIDVVPIGASVFDDPGSCQLKKCENTRAKELEEAIVETPAGEGFKAALASWIDWPAFHRFQCLSWVLATGDDALHNSNNVVLVERNDGLFQYLPYSIDISLGQEWYPVVALAGTNSLARGCQSDPACWADTIAMCEDVIEDFAALDPNAVLKGIYDELSDHGMLRAGDEARYESLDAWITQQLEVLPVELERNRDEPQPCAPPQIDCGGYCGYPQDCWMGAGAGAVGAGEVGAGGGDAGAGGAGEVGVGGGGPGAGGEGGASAGGGSGI